MVVGEVVVVVVVEEEEVSRQCEERFVSLLLSAIPQEEPLLLADLLPAAVAQ